MTPYAVARVYCSGPHERFYRQRVWIAGYPFYRCVGGPTAKDTVFTTLVADRGDFLPDWRVVEVWLHCPDGPCDKTAVKQILKGLTIRRGYWPGG